MMRIGEYNNRTVANAISGPDYFLKNENIMRISLQDGLQICG